MNSDESGLPPCKDRAFDPHERGAASADHGLLESGRAGAFLATLVHELRKELRKLLRQALTPPSP